MQKPQNRKERVHFLMRKKGHYMADILVSMSDHELKEYFNAVYPMLKDKPDNDYYNDILRCVRCGEEIEHHYNLTARKPTPLGVG